MNILYKDYENPSFVINDHGYFLPGNDLQINEYNYANELSQYIIPSEHNISYCPEANIITKINLNKENYFDFNKAIIDIGAFVGVYSIRTFFKKGYVFEPNKTHIVFSEINLMMHNKFNDFKCYNVLLSDKNEMVKYDGFSNEHTFAEPLENISNNYSDIKLVKSHILDEYNCEDVGLIKIDVEGMEEKVLFGGVGTIIRNNYPPILFECWEPNYEYINVKYNMTQEKHDSLQQFLESLGYKILWKWGDFETHLAIHE